MIEKEHELYGGSSSDIWVNCHGWASLVKGMPEDPPTIHSLRGTALHTGVLEVKAKTEIEHRISGAELKFDYSNIEHWPEEGPELADEFWGIVWEKVLEQFITGKTIHIEKKLMLFSDLECGGTADFIVLYYSDKGKLVAVLGDCKFGKVRVEPDKEQLKFYLCALNKAVREKGKQIEEFRSFVYQPMHTEVFTEHKFTKNEIEKAEARYEKAIIESKKPNPKFKVGEHCLWCKAQGKCLAYKKQLDKDMEMMVIRNQEEVSFTPIESLSDESLMKIALFGEKISKYIKNVKKEVMLRFLNGKPVEGLKIVEGSSKRVIKNKEQVIAEFLKMGANAVKDPELKSLKDLTLELVNLGKPKKEADKIVDSFTEKPQGKPKITTSNDPKPDYNFTNAVSLLEDYDDSEY